MPCVPCDSDIAIALHTPPHRAVSLALVVQALGATQGKGRLSRMKTLHVSMGSSRRYRIKPIAAATSVVEAAAAAAVVEATAAAASEAAAAPAAAVESRAAAPAPTPASPKSAALLPAQSLEAMLSSPAASRAAPVASRGPKHWTPRPAPVALPPIAVAAPVP